MQYKTRGNSSPQGKPRVYFCCHPDDFAPYFDEICAQLFRWSDCAVWYSSASEPEPDAAERELTLGQMQLFVMPVTTRLLRTPNTAMDVEFPFAAAHHIPVLPLVEEPGLDALFSIRFGSLQYLEPHTVDDTAISFDERLKKFLNSVLLGDEVASRVRAAFDAYIFLSYRKKDRAFAQRLMRLIHAIPACRDLAIWYDEYLTPGEDFNDAIAAALQKSEIFTLVVTPNLISEDNYVRSTEYPMALAAQKTILPVEMRPTDSTELCKQYAALPACLPGVGGGDFDTRVLQTVRTMALQARDDSPEHDYLIGLAYLDGIDVEVDRDRARELIHSAAERELPEAMGTLIDMYGEGVGVARDYEKKLYWCKRLADCCAKTLGPEARETLEARLVYATVLGDLGRWSEAVEENERVYEIMLRTRDKEHVNTRFAMRNLDYSYGQMGQLAQEAALLEQILEQEERIPGERTGSMLTTMNNLASSYARRGNYHKAGELAQRVYELRCEKFGTDALQTLTALHNLAGYCGALGDSGRELALKEQIYDSLRQTLGDAHPETLFALKELSAAQFRAGDKQAAYDTGSRALAAYLEQFGARYPGTVSARNNVGAALLALGHLEEAETQLRETADAYAELYGPDHVDTLRKLYNLAELYSEQKQHEKSYALRKEIYARQCKSLGRAHPESLRTLNSIAVCMQRFATTEEIIPVMREAAELRAQTLGADHPETIRSLNNLGLLYERVLDYANAARCFESVYAWRCRTLGSDDRQTIVAQKHLERDRRLRDAQTTQPNLP